jgi:hypothetical protein
VGDALLGPGDDGGDPVVVEQAGVLQDLGDEGDGQSHLGQDVDVGGGDRGAGDGLEAEEDVDAGPHPPHRVLAPAVPGGTLAGEAVRPRGQLGIGPLRQSFVSAGLKCAGGFQ